MAWARLGTIHSNIGDFATAEEYTRKAFELRERTSEREKLYIISRYYTSVTGELDKQIETYELWKQTYPRDYTARNNLSVAYYTAGQPEQSLQEALEALRLAPDEPFPYNNVAGAYLAFNRFEEAKAICRRAVERKVGGVFVHVVLLRVAFYEGDQATMQHQLEWARGRPDEVALIGEQASAELFSGKLRSHRALWQKGWEIAERLNFPSISAHVALNRAAQELHFGSEAEAARWALRALDLSRGQYSWAAIPLALAGEPDKAQKAIDELIRRYPLDTRLREFDQAMVRAAIELRRGNPEKAAEALRPAARYEAVNTAPAYLRGLAFLKMKSGTHAAAEFKKMLDRRGLNPVHPMAQLGLARAYALSGDFENSRKAYQDLFALWKNADPDLRPLIEARREYEQLAARASK